VKRTYPRLPQADTQNYEDEEFEEKNPATRKAPARRPKEAGQAKTKATGGANSKGDKSQKEIGCEGFQANRSNEIGCR
jgi:hypothetical protein